MRKKIPEEDKKKTVSVSLHPKLIDLLEKDIEDNNINKSQLIEGLIEEYLKNNTNAMDKEEFKILMIEFLKDKEIRREIKEIIREYNDDEERNEIIRQRATF